MRSLQSVRKVPLAIAYAALMCCSCAVLIAGAAVGGAGGGVAAASDSQVQSHAPMTYVASVLASTVYFPAKVVFASGGAVTSGVAYLVTAGNTQSANAIWNASVEGDYVVGPEVIEGTRPLHFVGS